MLTPEEWVRQHVVSFLINEKKIPLGLISIEKEIKLNDLKKRYDIVVFNNDLSVYLVVECKAPYINLSETTLEQALRYNLILKANFVLITNGLKEFILKNNKPIKELENYV